MAAQMLTPLEPVMTFFNNGNIIFVIYRTYFKEGLTNEEH